MAIDLIDYKTWMSRTAMVGRFRSSQLEDLDKALKTYDSAKTDANLRQVRIVFEAWKLKEGMGWRQAPRNRDGVFSKLEDLLNPRDATPYGDALADSRRGLIYLFNGVEVEMGMGKVLIEGVSSVFEGVADLPGVSIPSAVTKEVSLKALSMQGDKPVGPKPGASAPQISLWEKIKQTFNEYAKKIYDLLKTQFSDFWNSTSLEKADTIWTYATKIVNMVSSNVLSSAIPFLGGAIDIANGIKDTTVACYHRYMAYSLGKGVVLNEGHPGVIAASIERAMNMGIGKGLYDTFKGAGKIAMEGASFGAASIVSLVITGCELIAKVIYRLYETSGMRSFFADCKARWTAKDKIYENGPDYTYWYSKAAAALPCISALAINSGITGDKMMYLNMFTDGTQKTTIGQAKFDQGVAYVDKLKAWSGKYLEDSGYDFSSRDSMVQALLKRVVASKKPVLTQISTKLATV